MPDRTNFEPRIFDGDPAKQSFCQKLLMVLGELASMASVKTVTADRIYNSISDIEFTTERLLSYVADRLTIERRSVQWKLIHEGLQLSRADGIYLWPIVSVESNVRMIEFSLGRPNHLKDHLGREVIYTRCILGIPLIVLGASKNFADRKATPQASYTGGCLFIMSEALNWGCVHSWNLFKAIHSAVKKGYSGSSAPELMVRYGRASWSEFLEAHYLLRTIVKEKLDVRNPQPELPDARFVNWWKNDQIRQTECHEIAGHRLDDLRKTGWEASELLIAEARALLAEIRYSETPFLGIVSIMKRIEPYANNGRENEGRLALASLTSAGLIGIEGAPEAIAKTSLTLTDAQLRSAAGRALETLAI